MSAIAPLSGVKQTSGEQTKYDVIDPNRNCSVARHNGVICSLPGVSGAFSLFGKCTPIRTLGALG